MSNSRMVDAVNRLIGTLLSGVGEVFLPGVGSLYAERQGARRTDKRTILPPCRVVSFSSQQRGTSLVDEIARAAQVGEEKATEIYETWLSRTRNEDTLTIEGVGELKFKNFTLDPAFDRLLNPGGHKPLKIKPLRRFDWVLWTGVAAILIATGFVGYQFLLVNSPEPVPEVPVRSVETEIVAEIPVDTLEVIADAEPAGADSVAAGASVPEPEAEPQPAVPDKTVQATVKGNCYVVLGVFSTTENAVRALEEMSRKDSQLQGRIYRFGEKFMVSPFGSDKAEACARFIRENSGRFSGMWTYTAR